MNSPGGIVACTVYQGSIDEEAQMTKLIERGVGFLEEIKISRRKKRREGELGELFFRIHRSGEVPFSQIHQEAREVAETEGLELSNIWSAYDNLDAESPG